MRALPARSGETLLVACLCAAWCHTCTDYRVAFDALGAEFRSGAQFLWVDIEDNADMLGEVDVVDFPTLLIARGDTVCFHGPVLPRAEVAKGLVSRALSGHLGAVHDARLSGLVLQLRAALHRSPG